MISLLKFIKQKKKQKPWSYSRLLAIRPRRQHITRMGVVSSIGKINGTKNLNLVESG